MAGQDLYRASGRRPTSPPVGRPFAPEPALPQQRTAAMSPNSKHNHRQILGGPAGVPHVAVSGGAPPRSPRQSLAQQSQQLQLAGGYMAAAAGGPTSGLQAQPVAQQGEQPLGQGVNAAAKVIQQAPRGTQAGGTSTLRRASDAMPSGGSGILQTASALASAPPMTGIVSRQSNVVGSAVVVPPGSTAAGLGPARNSQNPNKTSPGGVQQNGGGLPRDQTPAAVRGGSPPLAPGAVVGSVPVTSGALQALAGPRGASQVPIGAGPPGAAVPQLLSTRANSNFVQAAQQPVGGMPKAMPLKPAPGQVQGAKRSGNTTPLPPYGPTQASPRTMGPALLLASLGPPRSRANEPGRPF